MLRSILVLIMLVAALDSLGYADRSEQRSALTGATQGQLMDPAHREKMEEFTKPNEAHKVLEPLAGKWNYTGKFWMTADSEPQEMSGTTLNTMVYGGRFLKQEAEGPWMGETFHGIGYTGFDNVKKEYVSIWLEDMATGIMMVTGKYDRANKTLNFSGANSYPMTGEANRPGRAVWTLTDNDHNTYTHYTKAPDGREFRAMKLNYTRA